MIDGALIERLENWARAQWSGGVRACIASAEGNYRRPGVLYRDEAIIAPPIDIRDAALVNAAWQRLMPLDRDVLRMYYVWRAHSSFICRRLKLKQGRGHEHVWDLALHHAHKAIDAMLGNSSDLAKPIRYAYNREQITETVD